MSKSRLEQVLDLLKDEPDDAFLNHALAMEYLSAGREQEAIRIMESLLEKHPDHTGTYYHLGQAYLNSGNPEKAMNCWNEGMERSKLLKRTNHFRELQAAYNLLYDEND